MNKFIYWISLPKSVLFNFKYLPLNQAINLPIWIRIGTRCNINGKIEVNENNKKKFIIILGDEGLQAISPNRLSSLTILKGAKLIFEGNACIARGFSLRIMNGEMTIGKNLSCNKNVYLSCRNQLSFGEDVLIGWNVSIRDSDGHQVYKDGIPKKMEKQTEIGDHVWICSNATILKGNKIPNNSIVGYGAIVANSFYESNILIAGNPAEIKEKNISWEE